MNPALLDAPLASLGLTAHSRGVSRKWSGAMGWRKVDVLYAAPISGGNVANANIYTQGAAGNIRVTIAMNTNIATTFRSDSAPNPAAPNAVPTAGLPFANWAATSADPPHTTLLLQRPSAVQLLARVLQPPVRSLSLTSLSLQLVYMDPDRVHPDKLRQDLLDLAALAAEVEALPPPTVDSRQQALAAEAKSKKGMMTCVVIAVLVVVAMVVFAVAFMWLIASGY